MIGRPLGKNQVSSPGAERITPSRWVLASCTSLRRGRRGGNAASAIHVEPTVNSKHRRTAAAGFARAAEGYLLKAPTGSTTSDALRGHALIRVGFPNWGKTPLGRMAGSVTPPSNGRWRNVYPEGFLGGRAALCSTRRTLDGHRAARRLRIPAGDLECPARVRRPRGAVCTPNDAMSLGLPSRKHADLPR